MKKLWSVIKGSFKEWSEDKASRLAAALSYYTIFSLAPLLVIVIAIAGFVFGKQAAQGAIVQQISGLVGQRGAEQVQTMIQNANQPAAGLIATIVGIVLLLFGATGVFNQLQDSMNTIWEVRLKPGRGIFAMVRDRFLSFAMILGIAFLLLVSLVLSAALSAFGKLLVGIMPGFPSILQVINFIVSFGVISFLFVLIFKFLPDARISWKDAWIGGAVTSLLFTIGKQLIGVYLGTSSTANVFGVAGSLIILLLWIYYSGMILFFGAEFTQVYANTYGSGITPVKDAERVTEEERAEQGIPHRRSERGQKPTSGAVPTGGVVHPSGAVQPYFHPQTTTPKTAVPSSSPVPVTGEEKHNRILEVALPALLAAVIGISGSIAIAREQRKRPIIQQK
jgi:membrane protein